MRWDSARHQRQESHAVQRGREISVSEMEEIRETAATFWRLPRIHYRALLDSGLPSAACLPFRAQDGWRNCTGERSALFLANAALGAGLSCSCVTIFFAYCWIVALGVSAVKQGWQGVIHRRHRCGERPGFLPTSTPGASSLQLPSHRRPPEELRRRPQCIRGLAAGALPAGGGLPSHRRPPGLL
jgi:hypothetical protein